MPGRPGFSKGVQAAPPVLRAGPFACPLLRALALALCRVLISHDLRPFPCAPQVRFRSRTFLRAACVEAFACRPAPAMRCSLPGCRQAWEGSFPLSMTQGVGLSARVCALRYCLPDTRHIAPASFREEMGQGGHSHSQKGSLSCLGRRQALYGVQGKLSLRCRGRCRPARARGCGSGCGRDALLWVRILRTSLRKARISHSR